jgi:adenosylhomocysteinase
MDMSFAVQALAMENLVKNHKSMDAAVHTVPDNIDYDVASLKLKTMGITIDSLSEEQKRYMSGWEEGT